MPDRKHFFRIRSLKLNSRKERIPAVSCLEFFLPRCFLAPMKSAMLFLYIVTKHSVIVLPSLTEGAPLLLQNLVRVEFLSVLMTRTAASILIFAKFPFLCAQEETQFSVCNFREICKRISNVWKVPQLQTDDKISFEFRARFISLKNPSFDSWYWGSVSFCQLCKYLISLKLWDRILKLKINIQMKRALSLRNSSHFKKQIKTKSIAIIKNGGQCNSFLSDRNFSLQFWKSGSLQLPKAAFENKLYNEKLIL